MGSIRDQFISPGKATLSKKNQAWTGDRRRGLPQRIQHILPAVRLRHKITYQQIPRAPAQCVLEDSGEFGIAVRSARLRTQKIQSAKGAPGGRGMRTGGLRWRNEGVSGQGRNCVPREGTEKTSHHSQFSIISQIHPCHSSLPT
jgi:hypothetical protein